MFITMHCGGMPFNGDTINEKSLGGSETAAYYMALELAKKGHKVTLFTAINEYHEKDGVRYIPSGQRSDRFPLGEDFHHYAMNTPIDVLIIQRHPAAFLFPWASKVNLLWLHDLATEKSKEAIHAQLPFIDGMLTVSKWHKKQVVETWGVDESIVMPIQNGVDLSIYEGEINSPFAFPDKTTKLIYSSRPERGLENLVKEGGIMEKLGDDYHLYVCNYDNTVAHLAGYYSYLNNRCKDLPNVTMLGHLTKQDLADMQRSVDICVYPTAFEETSCITAMECAAAGLPMITSRVGALPETCRDMFELIPTIENEPNYVGLELRMDGKVDIDAFVEAVKNFNPEKYKDKITGVGFDWYVSAHMLLEHIDNILNKSFTATGYMRDCIRKSDFYALKNYMSEFTHRGLIADATAKEMEECYDFTNGKWAEHYKAYYEYEKNRGVNYGAERLDGNYRFEFVSDLVGTLPAGSTILDYGCAHGHYTINLAKRFPDKHFIGVDITQSNIDKATNWAASEQIGNASFIHGYVEGTELKLSKNTSLNADCIIAAEVLEHLEDPALCVDVLAQHLSKDGKMIITVPYGPWEAQGYKEHWPWRAHVHHMDKADLHELYGMHGGFDIVAIPAGPSADGEIMGSYVAMFNKPKGRSGKINYKRKVQESKPRQTLSLAMIAKDAAMTIEKTLESVKHIVAEIVVGIDQKTTDDTLVRVEQYCQRNHIPCKTFVIRSPLEVGFDEARNTVIDEASGDWILWLDSDEVLHNQNIVTSYLRNNQYSGYVIPQNHMSMQPMGVMKVDLPVKLFRNKLGIKFFGMVHEHPEKALNEGVGNVTNIPDVQIAHYGYENEPVRRQRFQRNIGLLIKDREKFPDRKLGKYLWLRDLAQMCSFELESNGGRITKEMIDRANEGVEIFEEMLADESMLRMAIDSLMFYSGLVQILGTGFEFNSVIEGQEIKGVFYSKEHLQRLIWIIMNQKIKTRGKYS